MKPHYSQFKELPPAANREAQITHEVMTSHLLAKTHGQWRWFDREARDCIRPANLMTEIENLTAEAKPRKTQKMSTTILSTNLANFAVTEVGRAGKLAAGFASEISAANCISGPCSSTCEVSLEALNVKLREGC